MTSSADRFAVIAILFLAVASSLQAQSTPNITSPQTLPPATLGTPYSYQFTVTGGVAPYSWTLVGALPAGLVLSVQGLITGTPTQSTSANFNVQVVDANNASQIRAFVLQVLTVAAPVITNLSFPDGRVGEPYSQALNSTGGCQTPFNPPRVFALAAGALPPGLQIERSDVGSRIAGTPTTMGSFRFTLQVTDSCSLTGTREFTITIQAAPNMTALPGALNFTYQRGQAVPPNQSFNIATGTVRLPYEVQLTTSDGRTWMQLITPARASTPDIVIIGLVNPDRLDPGTYQGFARVLSQAPNSPLVVQITLTVSSAATMNVTASTVTINGGLGSVPPVAQQSIGVSATGGQVNFTVAARAVTGGNWLAVNPTSATTPATLNIIANYQGLPPGSYQGLIAITSTAANSPVNVAVTLNVTADGGLRVSPLELEFRYRMGGTIPAAQVLSIGDGGSPTGFAVEATTASGGSWLFASPATGTTPSTLTVTVNPNNLAPGAYGGAIVVRPSGQTAGVSVRVTLVISLGGGFTAEPAVLSFNQTASGGTPPQRTLLVGSSGEAFEFNASAVTDNNVAWLFVTPSAGRTPAALTVSVNPQALSGPGTFSGAIVLTAPNTQTLRVPVALIVQSPSNIQLSAVVNAASFSRGPLAPGTVVTLFGTGIGPNVLESLQLGPDGKVTTTLGGTRVLFDEMPAPLVYVSSAQSAAVVPAGVASRASTRIVVERGTVRSNTLEFQVAPTMPGVFTIDSTGQGFAAVLNQDGSLNVAGNGAEPGSIISIYATGAGITSPPTEDGSVPATEPLPRAIQPVTVRIGGQPAEVLYAGAAPGLVGGVIQINARVPETVPRGQPAVLAVGMGQLASQAGVRISIRP